MIDGLLDFAVTVADMKHAVQSTTFCSDYMRRSLKQNAIWRGIGPAFCLWGGSISGHKKITLARGHFFTLSGNTSSQNKWSQRFWFTLFDKSSFITWDVEALLSRDLNARIVSSNFLTHKMGYDICYMFRRTKHTECQGKQASKLGQSGCFDKRYHKCFTCFSMPIWTLGRCYLEMGWSTSWV